MCGLKPKRQKTVVCLARDLGAEAAQSFKQIADRTLAHARDAVEPIGAPRKSQKRRQSACGGAGVADKKLRAFDGNASAASRDRHLRVGLKHNLDPQRLQRFDHSLGVVGSEQSGKRCFPLRHCRQKKSAVGD